MKAAVSVFSLLLGILLFSGCGSARYGEPITGEVSVSEAGLLSGKQLFQEHCHQCHPGGESGIGPALNNKPLPRSLLSLQVRKGLGEMPAFSENRIREAELESLIDYVEALAAATGSSEEANG